MENNKSKTNIHNQRSSTPAYLKEVDRLIQNHTNLITKQLSSGENSEIFISENDKILALKKSSLKVLSFIDEEKLKSVKHEQDELTLTSLKNLEEFSSELFQEPETRFAEPLFSDESFIDLISETNKTLECKYNSLLQKTAFYENLDLKSIKKLQGIFQEKENNKALTNFMVQLAPLQREYSYIIENLEGKKLKFSEKENTNKFNSSKAEAYRKELESTTEKYRSALAVQESCEKEYSQLLMEKNGLEAELAYIQGNLSEKVNKKGKKIKVFKLRESDEKEKMLIYNNQICLQEIEKAQMLNYDLCRRVKNFRTEKIKIEENRKQAQMLFFDVIRFKILQIRLSKAKAQSDRLDKEIAFLVNALGKLETSFEQFNYNQDLIAQKANWEKKLHESEKRLEKYQRIYVKIAAVEAKTA